MEFWWLGKIEGDNGDDKTLTKRRNWQRKLRQIYPDPCKYTLSLRVVWRRIRRTEPGLGKHPGGHEGTCSSFYLRCLFHMSSTVLFMIQIYCSFYPCCPLPGRMIVGCVRSFLCPLASAWWVQIETSGKGGQCGQGTCFFGEIASSCVLPLKMIVFPKKVPYWDFLFFWFCYFLSCHHFEPRQDDNAPWLFLEYCLSLEVSLLPHHLFANDALTKPSSNDPHSLNASVPCTGTLS